MKNLYYDEGPEVQSFGDAGIFRLGEPRQVEDDLAVILLRKGRLKEFKEPKETPLARGSAASPALPADAKSAAKTEKEV